MAAEDYYYHAKHCNLLVSDIPESDQPVVLRVNTDENRSSYEMAKAYFRRTLREEEISRARGL
jgi:hypothetical protein